MCYYRMLRAVFPDLRLHLVASRATPRFRLSVDQARQSPSLINHPSLICAAREHVAAVLTSEQADRTVNHVFFILEFGLVVAVKRGHELRHPFLCDLPQRLPIARAARRRIEFPSSESSGSIASGILRSSDVCRSRKASSRTLADEFLSFTKSASVSGV